MSDPASIDDVPFKPTHLIRLQELSQSEKEQYYDMLIECDAKFHRDSKNKEVLADVRILGPGVGVSDDTDDEKKEEGAR